MDSKLDIKTAKVLAKLIKSGAQSSEIVEEPIEIGKKYGIKIDESTKAKLTALGSSKSSDAPVDAIDKEILAFVDKALVDGRQVQMLTNNPKGVAALLDLPLSDAAADRINSVSIDDLIEVQNPDAIIARLIYVVIVWKVTSKPFQDHDIIYPPAIDFSEVEKL